MTREQRRNRFAIKFIILIGAMASAGALGTAWLVSCAAPGSQINNRYRHQHFYPPPPQSVRVVALGNLRSKSPPSRFEVELSVFLFGVEPEPPLGLVAPATLATNGHELLICDSVLNAIFKSDLASGVLQELVFEEPPRRPISIEIAPNGDRLVADLDTSAVYRYDRTGKQVLRYAIKETEFRPADCLCVGNEVWVSNAAAHKIEIFDAATGEHRRSIGGRGSGRGRFGIPLGLARSPDGDVCVVDTINNRVQVLSPEGVWKRDIGRPGDRVGCFGRPKTVAVGPDGSVFVVDAASQRVHAFDERGRPLLAFGEPASGVGALSMPSGIVVTASWRDESGRLPNGFIPVYYILVAEHLSEPGIRVYAWGRMAEAGPPKLARAPVVSRTTHESRAVNPHWSSGQCGTCHAMDGTDALAIRPEKINSKCLSCHDGHLARAEPHPIGRPGVSAHVQTPADWPTPAGRIGCLTCHDIRRHCDRSVRRPNANPAMLRSYHPDQPLDFCLRCHKVDENWRISPHDQVDSSGRIKTESCAFCHDQPPEISKDGLRRFAPQLRDDSSKLCLSCHTEHWDYFPEGHVERPMTEETRRSLIARELTRQGDLNAEAIAKIVKEEKHRPALLPLSDDRITCFTCHNPHEPGLLPPDSQIGQFATLPQDAAIALRMNHSDLCLACHPK